MDERLLQLYNRELRHLREMGGEFARDFPKIAGRLGLDELECADPYVERLLEGFAFLAARVQLRIESEFPRFTQQLFETVYPQYLSPTPSMAVVQFQPDLSEGSLAEGPLIPRGSVLRGQLGRKDQTRCTYTTAHDVRLWPVRIQEAAYHTRDLSSLGLGDTHGARAAIRLRLETTAGLKFAELPLERLVLHLTGDAATAMRLYEQLFTHVAAVVVHSPARPPAWQTHLPAAVVEPVGFDDEEALLPCGPRGFHGYRLLHEYFAFPARFMFAAVSGLGEAARPCDDTVLDLTILLREADLELESDLGADNFALGCAPAINLFEKRLDRIHLTDSFSELHVVADRTAPLDYEVHSISGVTGFGVRGQTEEQAFEPFYAARDGEADEESGYYVINRYPRTLSERERQGRRRSRYAGSEMFISLVDSGSAPYRADLRQLGINARCTNRDLPIQMPVGQGDTDFTLDGGAPVEAIRCVGSPTTPFGSHAEGEFAWRLVSHLTPNYLSLADGDGAESATALRDLLSLYGETARPEIAKQVDGVRSVASRPIVQRVGEGGPSAFARGLEVTATLDEAAFEGSGVFLLGAVLDRFFARFVTINVFTTTVIRSAQRGEIKRWPARIGRRQNI